MYRWGVFVSQCRVGERAIHVVDHILEVERTWSEGGCQIAQVAGAKNARDTRVMWNQDGEVGQDRVVTAETA
jgi:hypothetical protein